eukprot:m51a1_g5458 hypothetical protein (1344) ;mRNA; f:232243-237797
MSDARSLRTPRRAQDDAFLNPAIKGGSTLARALSDARATIAPPAPSSSSSPTSQAPQPRRASPMRRPGPAAATAPSVSFGDPRAARLSPSTSFADLSEASRAQHVPTITHSESCTELSAIAGTDCLRRSRGGLTPSTSFTDLSQLPLTPKSSTSAPPERRPLRLVNSGAAFTVSVPSPEPPSDSEPALKLLPPPALTRRPASTGDAPPPPRRTKSPTGALLDAKELRKPKPSGAAKGQQQQQQRQHAVMKMNFMTKEGVIEAGEEVSVLAIANGWALCDASGSQVFLPMSYITLSQPHAGPGAGAAAAPPKPAAKRVARRTKSSGAVTDAKEERDHEHERQEHKLARPVAVAAAPVLLLNGLKPRAHSRICDVSADSVLTLSRLGDLARVIPPEYSPPPLLQAAREAKIHAAEEVVESCMELAAHTVPRELKERHGLTDEDVAAIALYTFDLGSVLYDLNPYRVLNSALFERNTLALRSVRGLLYRLLQALRKLPPVTGAVLHRGVAAQVPTDAAHYQSGRTVTWHTLCSTTTNLAVTKDFLTDRSTGIISGTLFNIRGGWGYDIAPFSFVQSEREILLEPEMDYVVQGVLETGSLTVIELEMQKTPLLVPQITGSLRASLCESPRPGRANRATHTQALTLAAEEQHEDILCLISKETNLLQLCECITAGTESICAAAMDRITQILTDSPVMSSDFAQSEKTVWSLEAALQRFPGSQAALRSFFSLASTLLDCSPATNKEAPELQRCSSEGAVSALQRFSNNTDLAFRACALLDKVARVTPELSLEFARSEGMSALVSALKTHGASLRVAESCTAVFCLLSCDCESKSALSAFISREGVELALQTLRPNIACTQSAQALLTFIGQQAQRSREASATAVDNEGLELTLRAIDTNRQSPDAVQTGFTALAGLTSFVDGRALAIDLGAVQKCIEFLRPLEPLPVVQAVLVALASVTTTAENLLASADHDERRKDVSCKARDAIPLVATVLRKYCDSAAAVERAIAVLCNIATTSDSVRVAVRENCVDSVLDSLRLHSCSASVVLRACRWLSAIASNPSARAIIFEDGGIAALLSLLKRNAGSPDVAGWAALAMANASHADNAVSASQEGAISTVVAALRMHEKSPEAAKNLCLAIGHLTKTNEENRIAAGARGVIEVLVSILISNVESCDVVLAACVALTNLIIANENKSAFVRGGGLSAIIRALERNFASEGVAHHACTVLCLLSKHDEKFRDSIVVEGGIAPVVAALRAHTECEKVLVPGCTALWNLLMKSGLFGVSSVPEYAEAVAKEGGFDVIVTVARLHSRNEPVASIACRILSITSKKHVDPSTRKELKKLLSSELSSML